MHSIEGLGTTVSYSTWFQVFAALACLVQTAVPNRHANGLFQHVAGWKVGELEEQGGDHNAKKGMETSACLREGVGGALWQEAWERDDDDATTAGSLFSYAVKKSLWSLELE